MIFALVPAFNEEKKIAAVVRSLLAQVNEVVVIDDGSNDATAQEAALAGATVLVHTLNRGQGAALETGHEYAREQQAEVVVHFDADGQFDPSDVGRGLVALQETGADIVLGSRFLEKTSELPWLKRHLVLPFGRLVDRFFGGVRLTDAHNGFRVLNKRALSVLCLTQDRMAHATEIPQLIARHQLSYSELPITVSYHEFGQGPFSGLKILRDLVWKKLL